MTGRINKENKTITELPTMEKPVMIVNVPKHLQRELYDSFSAKWEKYHEHLKSLRTFPYSGEWKAETGDTVSFDLLYQYLNIDTAKAMNCVYLDCSKEAYELVDPNFRRVIAIPLPDKQAAMPPYFPKGDYGPKEGETSLPPDEDLYAMEMEAHKQDSEDVNQAAEAAAMNIFGIGNDKVHDRGNYYNGFVDGYKYAKQQPIPPSTYTGEREAITFAEWIRKNRGTSHGSDHWWLLGDGKFTTAELYQQFKNQSSGITE